MATRSERRADLDAKIMATARRQLAEHGAGQLGMRAIARELGLTPGALYRYVADRDALLTRLIVEAYDSLGAALEEASARARTEGPRGQWLAVWRAARAWALSHQHEFALVYGTPVTGYAAPEETIEPASRTPAALASIVVQSATPVPPRPLADDLETDLAQVRGWALDRFGQDAATVGNEQLLGVVRARTELIGTISFELSGHYLGSVTHASAYLDEVAQRHADALGLPG